MWRPLTLEEIKQRVEGMREGGDPIPEPTTHVEYIEAPAAKELRATEARLTVQRKPAKSDDSAGALQCSLDTIASYDWLGRADAASYR